MELIRLSVCGVFINRNECECACNPNLVPRAVYTHHVTRWFQFNTETRQHVVGRMSKRMSKGSFHYAPVQGSLLVSRYRLHTPTALGIGFKTFHIANPMRWPEMDSFTRNRGS